MRDLMCELKELLFIIKSSLPQITSLTLCSLTLSPLLYYPAFFLLPLFCPNSKIIISPIPDNSYRNVNWNSGLERGSTRWAAAAQGKQSPCSFMSACFSAWCSYKQFLPPSHLPLLISTFLPWETFPFVMTHVHHL